MTSQGGFDAHGRLAGDATAGCVALVPSWFQRRGTTHPAVAGLLLPAVQFQRVGSTVATAVLNRINDILEAMHPLAADYGRAEQAAAGLKPGQVELDKALHGLMTTTGGSSVNLTSSGDLLATPPVAASSSSPPTSRLR